MNDNASIKITPVGLEVSDLNFPDALQLLASAMLQLMNNTLEFASDEKERHALRGDVYDATNQAFSAVLEAFYPNEDDTFLPEEVLEIENKVLEDQLEYLRGSNPRLYKKRMKAYRQHLSDMRAQLYGTPGSNATGS